MQTEQSQSLNKTTDHQETECISKPARYTHPLTQAVYDSQQAFGLEKYGIPLSAVPDNAYNWQLMALEESVDMNQYLTREVARLQNLLAKERELTRSLREEVVHLQNYHNIHDPRGPVGSKGRVLTDKQMMEMKAHGYDFDSKI